MMIEADDACLTDLILNAAFLLNAGGGVAMRTRLLKEARAASKRFVIVRDKILELEEKKNAASGRKNYKEAAKLVAETNIIAIEERAATATLASLTAELDKIGVQEDVLPLCEK